MNVNIEISMSAGAQAQICGVAVMPSLKQQHQYQ